MKNKNILAFLPKTDLHLPQKQMYEVKKDVRRSTYDIEYAYEYECERSSRRRYLTLVATALSNVRRDGDLVRTYVAFDRCGLLLGRIDQMIEQKGSDVDAQVKI